ASIRSNGELTRLASIVVVPLERWKAAASRAAAASPVVKVCPPPPCTWMSTNPGTSQCPLWTSSAAAGETPAISGPSTDTTPDSMTPSGVTTLPAILTRAPQQRIVLHNGLRRVHKGQCEESRAQAARHVAECRADQG